MHSPSVLILLLTQYVLLPFLVEAAVENITVDDSQPDPRTGALITYSSSGWLSGNGCQVCAAVPNSSDAFDATWHDATYIPNSNISTQKEVETARFTFNGEQYSSAIYVYGIQCHTSGIPNCNADIQFYIDGQQVPQSYTFTPDNPGINTYDYNVLLYANNSLPMGAHAIQIQNGVQGVSASLILLDYLVYTTDTDAVTTSSSQTTSSATNTNTSAPPAAPHSHSNNSLTIALAVAIPVAVALLAGLLLLLYLRRRRQHVGLYAYDLDPHRAKMSEDRINTIPTPFTSALVPSDEQALHHGPGQSSPTREPLLSYKNVETPRTTTASSSRQVESIDPSSTVSEPQNEPEIDMPPPAYDTIPAPRAARPGKR
ncbi:hypothetical protein NM688_g5929 [Phlebia brevispora]|uniref:Uncharacterized protein n=1 Tax=Phlebia brevispora TaxID=194682 RepID=A0ACC1SMS4_9APHY|nr:hypothetical protein NM688_g5929 [Phlebia brevispora]